MRREELYLVRQGLPSLSVLTYTTSVILVSVDEKHDNKLLLELIDIPAFFLFGQHCPIRRRRHAQAIIFAFSSPHPPAHALHNRKSPLKSLPSSRHCVDSRCYPIRQQVPQRRILCSIPCCTQVSFRFLYPSHYPRLNPSLSEHFLKACTMHPPTLSPLTDKKVFKTTGSKIGKAIQEIVVVVRGWFWW